MTPAIYGLLIGLTIGAVFTVCAYIIGRSDGYKIGTLKAWQDYKSVLVSVKSNLDRLAADVKNASFFEADNSTNIAIRKEL